MRGSRDHILTNHEGALLRPTTLIEANGLRQADGTVDEAQYQQQLITCAC